MENEVRNICRTESDCSVIRCVFGKCGSNLEVLVSGLQFARSDYSVHGGVSVNGKGIALYKCGSYAVNMELGSTRICCAIYKHSACAVSGVLFDALGHIVVNTEHSADFAFTKCGSGASFVDLYKVANLSEFGVCLNIPNGTTLGKRCTLCVKVFSRFGKVVQSVGSSTGSAESAACKRILCKTVFVNFFSKSDCGGSDNLSIKVFNAGRHFDGFNVDIHSGDFVKGYINGILYNVLRLYRLAGNKFVSFHNGGLADSDSCALSCESGRIIFVTQIRHYKIVDKLGQNLSSNIFSGQKIICHSFHPFFWISL